MRSALAILFVVAALVALPATAAAASCELASSISPGHVITITGSGFAPNTDVDIKQVWSGSNATAGGNTGPQTTTSRVTADANGGFEFTIAAGPGHGGTYDVEATGGGCTATTHVVAVETAGGVNPGSSGTGGGGGTAVGTPAAPQATPPATDAAPVAERGGSVPVLPVGAAAMGLALVALAYARRRARVA